MDELITQYGGGDGASVGDCFGRDEPNFSVGERFSFDNQYYRSPNSGKGYGYGTYKGRGYTHGHNIWPVSDVPLTDVWEKVYPW